jgi:hypothetical protein
MTEKKDRSFGAYLKYVEQQLGLVNVRLDVERLEDELAVPIIRKHNRDSQRRAREMQKLRKRRDEEVRKMLNLPKLKGREEI